MGPTPVLNHQSDTAAGWLRDRGPPEVISRNRAAAYAQAAPLGHVGGTSIFAPPAVSLTKCYNLDVSLDAQLANSIFTTSW
jgi:hypothetical protein